MKLQLMLGQFASGTTISDNYTDIGVRSDKIDLTSSDISLSVITLYLSLQLVSANICNYN